MSDNVFKQLEPTDSNTVIDNVNGVQTYDGVVDANFTVFMVNSADVPPMTTAR